MDLREPSLRALSFGKSVPLMRLLLSQNLPGEDYITTQPLLCPEMLLAQFICWSSFQKKKKKKDVRLWCSCWMEIWSINCEPYVLSPTYAILSPQNGLWWRFIQILNFSVRVFSVFMIEFFSYFTIKEVTLTK